MGFSLRDETTNRVRAAAERQHAPSCMEPAPSRQMVVECGVTRRCLCSCGAVVVVREEDAR